MSEVKYPQYKGRGQHSASELEEMTEQFRRLWDTEIRWREQKIEDNGKIQTELNSTVLRANELKDKLQLELRAVEHLKNFLRRSQVEINELKVEREELLKTSPSAKLALKIGSLKDVISELQESNRVVLQLIENIDPDHRTEALNQIQAHIMGVDDFEEHKKKGKVA